MTDPSSLRHSLLGGHERGGSNLDLERGVGDGAFQIVGMGLVVAEPDHDHGGDRKGEESQDGAEDGHLSRNQMGSWGWHVGICTRFVASQWNFRRRSVRGLAGASMSPIGLGKIFFETILG